MIQGASAPKTGNISVPGIAIPSSSIEFNGNRVRFSNFVSQIYDNYSYKQRGICIFSYEGSYYKIRGAIGGLYNSINKIVGNAVGTINGDGFNFVTFSKSSASEYYVEFAIYDTNWSNKQIRYTMNQSLGSEYLSVLQFYPEE